MNSSTQLAYGMRSFTSPKGLWFLIRPKGLLTWSTSQCQTCRKSMCPSTLRGDVCKCTRIAQKWVEFLGRGSPKNTTYFWAMRVERSKESARKISLAVSLTKINFDTVSHISNIEIQSSKELLLWNSNSFTDQTKARNFPSACHCSAAFCYVASYQQHSAKAI